MYAKMIGKTPEGMTKEYNQEFSSKEQCAGWLDQKRLSVARGITLLDKTEHWLTLEMPISREVTVIFGDCNEIAWLHVELLRRRMYSGSEELPGNKYVLTKPGQGTTMFPVSLTMTPEQKAKGTRLAYAQGVNFSQFMRSLIDNYKE